MTPLRRAGAARAARAGAARAVERRGHPPAPAPGPAPTSRPPADASLRAVRRCAGAAWLVSGLALAQAPLLQPLDAGGEAPPAPWHVVGLPDQHKPYTHFTLAELESRRVLRIDADESYGHLVHPLSAPAEARVLAWRWRVDRPNDAADLARRAADDSPAKVCALFDLPLDAVPFVERQLLRYARSRSRDAVPGATLCYVWDAHSSPGRLLPNAFTGQVRQIVLQGQGTALHQWVGERRDLRADFLRAFGDEAREMPPLIGIAIGADADNTHAHSVAYLTDLTLER